MVLKKDADKALPLPNTPKSRINTSIVIDVRASLVGKMDGKAENSVFSLSEHI